MDDCKSPLRRVESPEDSSVTRGYAVIRLIEQTCQQSSIIEICLYKGYVMVFGVGMQATVIEYNNFIKCIMWIKLLNMQLVVQ